jgi:hypothetical protein
VFSQGSVSCFQSCSFRPHVSFSFGVCCLPGHARYLQLVNVWVEDPIHKPDTRRLIRVLVGQLVVDFPDAAFEGSCMRTNVCERPAVCGFASGPERQGERDRLLLTFRGALEAHKELLPAPSGDRVSVCCCGRVGGVVMVVGAAYTAGGQKISPWPGQRESAKGSILLSLTSVTS